MQVEVLTFVPVKHHACLSESEGKAFTIPDPSHRSCFSYKYVQMHIYVGLFDLHFPAVVCHTGICLLIFDEASHNTMTEIFLMQEQEMFTQSTKTHQLCK